jgi:hypothetical protein
MDKKRVAALIRKGLARANESEFAHCVEVKEGLLIANVCGLALIGKKGPFGALQLALTGFHEAYTTRCWHQARQEVYNELGVTSGEFEALVTEHFGLRALEIAARLEDGTLSIIPFPPHD